MRCNPGYQLDLQTLTCEAVAFDTKLWIDDGWYVHYRADTKIPMVLYKFYDGHNNGYGIGKQTYQQALDYCNYNSTPTGVIPSNNNQFFKPTLASILTNDEDQFLIRLKEAHACANCNVWIGASRTEETNSWFWNEGEIRGGSPVCFSNCQTWDTTNRHSYENFYDDPSTSVADTPRLVQGGNVGTNQYQGQINHRWRVLNDESKFNWFCQLRLADDESLEELEQCKGADAVLDDGLCVCDRGYYYSEDDDSCVSLTNQGWTLHDNSDQGIPNVFFKWFGNSSHVLDWHEAQDACSNLGHHAVLAAALNSNEYATLLNLRANAAEGSDQRAWLGGYQTTTNTGPWNWLEGSIPNQDQCFYNCEGSSDGFTNWAPNEPSENHERHVEVYERNHETIASMWNDQTRTDVNRYWCQVRL